LSDVIVDACCLINLCTSLRLREILDSTGHRFFICPAVKAESMFFEFEVEGKLNREEVDLDSHIASGTLTLAQVQDVEETSLYVKYAANLDDGEAMSMAIAAKRGWTLMTDDRRARKIAVNEGITIIDTTEAVHSWLGDPTRSAEARKVIQSIVRFARFTPRSDAAYADWWQRHM